jgi:hypothetical protein
MVTPYISIRLLSIVQIGSEAVWRFSCKYAIFSRLNMRHEIVLIVRVFVIGFA